MENREVINDVLEQITTHYERLEYGPFIVEYGPEMADQMGSEYMTVRTIPYAYYPDKSYKHPFKSVKDRLLNIEGVSDVKLGSAPEIRVVTVRAYQTRV